MVAIRDSTKLHEETEPRLSDPLPARPETVSGHRKKCPLICYTSCLPTGTGLFLLILFPVHRTSPLSLGENTHTHTHAADLPASLHRHKSPFRQRDYLQPHKGERRHRPCSRPRGSPSATSGRAEIQLAQAHLRQREG